MVLTEAPAGAITCPVVDPSSHAVTPAPAPSVNWSGCNLTNANLSSADLTGADLHAAIFTGATLTGATLTGADMSSTSLVNAKMASTALGGTNMASAALTGVSSGSITGSPSLPLGWKLIHGYLIGRGANLAAADLHGQNLQESTIEDANLIGANLASANVSSVVAVHANLTNAKLTSANLSTSDFRYAIFKGATLAGANVNAALFQYAALDGISTGGLTGLATSLPEGWSQSGGYFIYSLGLLRVTTTPAVPAHIYVDGVQRDTWGLQWLKIAIGTHQVCFGQVAAFDAPDCQTVTVNLNTTTTVNGTYVQRGYLHVSTNPPVAAQISIDGAPRDNWGVFTDVPVGPHLVCFESLDNLTAPPCTNVEVTAGHTTEYTGTFTPSTVGGLAGVGYLRVTTSPALPSQISVDGVYADTWGLTWLALNPGDHQVCWSDVAGYSRPACQTVTLAENQTSTAVGAFTQRGYLKVETSPAVPATIYMDGVPMDDWGLYTDVDAASHFVCFGDAATYVVPTCADHAVPAGGTTTVSGTYTNYPSAAPASG